MEEFFISEVFPPSSVTDATIVTNFFEVNADALAIARGNRLVIYKIEDQYSPEPQIYEMYGEIMRLIPITYSHPSLGNLLVILNDYRVSILSADENDYTHIKTISNGTIMPSCDEHLPPIKYALHPNALVLQILHSKLDVFPITSNSELDAPFQVEIGCRRIIDFHFIGPTAKVTRLAVLTEEFNKPPTLRLIEIDSTNKTFNEDTEKSVTLPFDTYKIIPYDPENKSIIIAFSTQRAIRVLYTTLTPATTTATIFTKDPLTFLLALKPNFYMAIDKQQNLKVVKLEEEGTVHFIDVTKCPNPSSVAAISSSLAFIGSETDDSIIYTVEEGNNSPSSTVYDTIKSTGPCLKFFKEEHNILSIFERAIVESKLMSEYRISMKISCKYFSKVFPFILNDEITCYLLSTGQETKIIGSNLDGEFIDFRNNLFCYEYRTIIFSVINKKIDEKNDPIFLQITEKKIHLLTPDNLLSFLDVDNSIVDASINDLSFAYCTVNSVHFYELDFQSSQFLVEKNLNVNSKLKGEVTSIALNESFIAVSTSSPTTVLVFQLPNSSSFTNSDNFNEFQKFELEGNIIDLTFAFDHLIALDVIGKVTVIDYLKNETFVIRNNSPKYFNTSFSILNNREVLVCGESPFIINDRFEFLGIKCSSGNNNCIINAANFDGSLIALNSDSLMIGTLQQPAYSNTSYISETPIIDIFTFDDLYITVRSINSTEEEEADTEADSSTSSSRGNTIEALFISTDKFGFNSNIIYRTINEGQKEHKKLTKGEPFYTLTDDRYIGYYFEKNNLFIGTSTRVLRFRIDTKEHLYENDNDSSSMIIVTFCGQMTYAEIEDINKQQSQKQQSQQQTNSNTNSNTTFIVNGFGTFRDYAYIQYKKHIDFYAVDISNPSGCKLFPILTLKKFMKDEIVYFTCSNLLLAIYTFGRYVIAYTFDEFNEKFVPLPYYQSFTDLSAISIFGRKILCATKSGNIFSLKHICSNNSVQADFVVDEAISIGEQVTIMKTFKDIKTTMIGTRNGMVMNLRSLKSENNKEQDHNQKFLQIYQLLAERMTSLGRFSKKFQRAPREDKYILSGKTIYDIDLIKHFLALSKNEQEKILGSNFSPEEARECLQIDANY